MFLTFFALIFLFTGVRAEAQNGYDSHEMACYAKVADSCDQAALKYDQIAKAGGDDSMSTEAAFKQKLFLRNAGVRMADCTAVMLWAGPMNMRQRQPRKTR